MGAAMGLAEGEVMGVAVVRAAMKRRRGVVGCIVGEVGVGWCVVGESELRVDGEKGAFLEQRIGGLYISRAEGVRLGSRNGWITSMDHLGY